MKIYPITKTAVEEIVFRVDNSGQLTDDTGKYALIQKFPEFYDSKTQQLTARL